MNTEKAIVLIAGAGFLRAYSGTLYLIKELESLGCDVAVWVRCSKKDFAAYKQLDLNIKSLEPSRIVPKFARGFVVRCSVFLKIIKYERVILTENTYLIEAAVGKKIKQSRLKLVHYCQELHLSADYPQLKRAKTLDSLAAIPDRVIDVEPNRAKCRMETLALPRRPWVIPNTIPSSTIPPRQRPGFMQELAGRELPKHLPILLHMGGIGKEKPLDRLLKAVSLCGKPVFFLAFCNGEKKQLDRLRSQAAKLLDPNMCAIIDPKPREQLLGAIWEADIGVVDYSPSVENTKNQLYCAPTKLFEFMALGLAILGSDNPSLRDIVEAGKVGVCAKNGEPQDLADALEQILSRQDELSAMKNRSSKLFKEKYCYEIVAKKTVVEVKNYLIS